VFTINNNLFRSCCFLAGFKRKGGSEIHVLLALIVFGAIIYCWKNNISIDKLVYRSFTKNLSDTPSVVHLGVDWTIVDGVRWFKVNGTDTMGIGYHGWVSEMSFCASPPVQMPNQTKDILSKLGLPTIEERSKAIKQQKKLAAALQKALFNP